MTDFLFKALIASALVAWVSGRALRAADDVTIYKPPASSSSTTAATSTDGTPVVHKSLHKKKKAVASTSSGSAGTATAGTSAKTPAATGSATTATSATPSTATSTGAGTVAKSAAKKKSTRKTTHTAASVPKKTIPTPPLVVAPGPITPAPSTSPISAPAFHIPGDATAPPLPSPTSFSSVPMMTPAPAGAPLVETGLPVARRGSATAAPLMVTPSPLTSTGLYRHASHPDESLPGFVTSPNPGATEGEPVVADNFKYTNFEQRTHTYPWKENIFTTMFYIGEGGTTISATTNRASSWDEQWVHSMGGVDDPDDRDGLLAGGHASTVNPFYIALPFNDLAFPDKARRWLPEGWYKSTRPGEKPQSACKNRWVEIKNARGAVCYAQWEDVGPLRYDHAEYVFGPERPDTYTRAGLDVSPAVYTYLGLDGGRNRLTAWRFVDDGDVPPGKWLKYNELAVIYQAIEEQSRARRSSGLQIQRAEAPLEDPDTIQSNENRVKDAR